MVHLNLKIWWFFVDCGIDHLIRLGVDVAYLVPHTLRDLLYPFTIQLFITGMQSRITVVNRVFD
ncbi:hypothetical protein HanRHA438_Chr09g0404571 [Helianthus annuus]|nr:hypothetical protein HanRHA438_Chr09g0404571 [Helianthus annuus]